MSNNNPYLEVESFELNSDGDEFGAFEMETTDEAWQSEVGRRQRFPRRGAGYRHRPVRSTRQRAPQRRYGARPSRRPVRPARPSPRPRRPPSRLRRLRSLLPVAYPYPWPPPEAGSDERVERSSEFVRWVQSSLNQVMNLRLPVDGVMGPATRSAIRGFQQREGLPVDGIVGPDTERALQNARAGQSGAEGNRRNGKARPNRNGKAPGPEASPAAEFNFEWETLNNALEFTDQESHSGITRSVPKRIVLYNTDLDAPYFGGNFDFLYNGGSNEAVITFNTHLSYRKRYSNAQKRSFINNLNRAVDVWDSAAEVQVKDINGNYSKKIKLRFKLKIVQDPKHSNKKTDIHPNATRSTWFIGKGRETVVRELNVFIGSSRNVLVHELGHVWGLLDEYDTRWIEKKFSLGHVGTGSPLIKDKIAIMNEGFADEVWNTGEFRGRYFMHFGRAILNAFWGVKDYVIPIKHNGKVVARSVQGRIALLKKDIAGSAPYASDRPFNPRFAAIQVAKK